MRLAWFNIEMDHTVRSTWGIEATDERDAKEKLRAWLTGEHDEEPEVIALGSGTLDYPDPMMMKVTLVRPGTPPPSSGA